MVKKLAKGGQLIQTAYWSVFGMASAATLTVRPVFAAPTGSIWSRFSASLHQQGTSESDMVSKLTGVSDRMFPVTYEIKEQERVIPVSYTTYKQVTITVVTSVQVAGVVNGVTRYNHTTEKRTYFLPDEVCTSAEAVTVPKFRSVTATLPIYSGGRFIGTRSAAYYETDGEEALEPTKEIRKYVECTIHPFDASVIATAFGIDLSAKYPYFDLTYEEVIENMANSLKMTLCGTLDNGLAVPHMGAKYIYGLGR